MSREPIVLTREALYGQVWAQPVQKVAQHLGISDVALAKICRKLGVPVPPRGFWARHVAGHAVTRPALPPPKTGQPTTHRLVRRSDPLMDAELNDDVKEQRARDQEPAHAIVVSDTLADPHPLVRLSTRLLRKASTRDSIREQEKCLDISVSNATFNRALRIMDALIKGLERRGLVVEVTAPKRGPAPRYTHERQEHVPSKTGVHIGDAFVEFGIEEACDIIKIDPTSASRRSTHRFSSVDLPVFISAPRYEHRPNGRLVLRIRDRSLDSARRSWSDGKRQRLENCLHDFVQALISTAERIRLRRLEAERRERERLEEERRREEEARRRQHEARLVHDLNSRIKDWTAAKVIREFVKAAEEDSTQRLGVMDPGSDLSRWIAWARQRADQLEASAVQTLLQLRIPPEERDPYAPWRSFV